MSRASDIVIREMQAETQQIAYRAPIKFGGRVVLDVTLLHVHATVETRSGVRATGSGSMPLGNVWGWPTDALTADQTLAAMEALGHELVRRANACDAFGHPLELTTLLAEEHQDATQRVIASAGLSETMPTLAQLVVASPLEAAIHDAYGRAHQQNAYRLLGQDWCNRDLSTYLDERFTGEYLDRYTAADPQPRLPLYHLVGALDPLSPAELQQPVGDGLPEALGDWIAADGLTHMKIKLSGDDLAWDIERVAGVESVAADAQAARGVEQWHYSLDFNERCENVAYVLDFLARLAERAPQALDRVQYIEQPTHRDLKANPDNKMHAAARIKPVVIDESLIDYESLLLSQEQGYSGVALKACKGQTEALLMGAAAQKFGMFLCVQDLTCVGASFLHSASLAARVPTVAAIEGNGRQYCPAGNRDWEQRYPAMFKITDGTVGTGCLDEVGLGFSPPD